MTVTTSISSVPSAMGTSTFFCFSSAAPSPAAAARDTPRKDLRVVGEGFFCSCTFFCSFCDLDDLAPPARGTRGPARVMVADMQADIAGCGDRVYALSREGYACDGV
jgi:hypothetical protein